MKKNRGVTTNTMLVYESIKKSLGEKAAREVVEEIIQQKLLLRALSKFHNDEDNVSTDH
jgi:hypothetical protein